MRRSKFVLRWILATGIALLSTSLPARGQAVRVVVLDSANSTPISDAFISLIDTTAGLMGLRRTNDRGVSWLTVPSAGHYAVFVQKQGYAQLVSNWLTFGNTDTLEVTFRLTATAQMLGRVVITAALDSIGPLLPRGLNAKTLAGRVIKPSEIATHSMGAGSYLNILESVGRGDFRITRWGDSSCVTPTRQIRRSSMSRPLCARVYVNNMRADFVMAQDLVTPENLDFAVWVRASEAGALYGSALPGEDETVLLLYTKDWRLTMRKPD